VHKAKLQIRSDDGFTITLNNWSHSSFISISHLWLYYSLWYYYPMSAAKDTQA